ncbi:MAG: hypothetical protein ACK5MN_00005 [Lachnospiraceae bacterium]
MRSRCLKKRFEMPPNATTPAAPATKEASTVSRLALSVAPLAAG